jgi:hypothetical protein
MTTTQERATQRYTDRYGPCIVPDAGHINKDGYVRTPNKNRKFGGRLVMLHRLEWEKAFGSIPDGYEVNHKCGNRACSNLNHLEILTREDHLVMTNRNRYRFRSDKIFNRYLKDPSVDRDSLASEFGVSRVTVDKNICKYKKEFNLNTPKSL